MCGLSTAEVARAFLVTEPTRAARITRAKKKIAVPRIPYRVPSAKELPERVDAVLSVVHLLVTTGHTTPAGDELVRRDLAVHGGSASWDDTDWREIVALYDVLTAVWPSPVVALDRAVAVGFASGAEAGLAALVALGGEPQLAGYGYLPAARGGFLRRLGRREEARVAYEEALVLTGNAVERDFLAARLRQLGGGPS